MLIPAPLAKSDVRGVSMAGHSQIANMLARVEIRKTGDAPIRAISQNADMDESEDKNGGPNHLSAWMRYRKVKGAALAKTLEITPGMVSDLANSKRALSAKWLRRIAPALHTTPGMLLDHDPATLDSDLIEIWVEASLNQRKTLSDIAKAVVKSDDQGPRDGTHG